MGNCATKINSGVTSEGLVANSGYDFEASSQQSDNDNSPSASQADNDGSEDNETSSSGDEDAEPLEMEPSTQMLLFT